VNDFDHAAEIAGALQARLADVQFPLTEPIEREIQQQVCQYADKLKALGLPPERVIVAVKRVANEAGVRSTARVVPSTIILDGKDKLLVDIVGWCIERYYDRPQHGD
jgi:sulfur carrier protein ThiS